MGRRHQGGLGCGRAPAAEGSRDMVPSAGLTMAVRAGRCWGGAGSPQDRSEGEWVAAEGVQVPGDTIAALLGGQGCTEAGAAGGG